MTLCGLDLLNILTLLRYVGCVFIFMIRVMVNVEVMYRIDVPWRLHVNKKTINGYTQEIESDRK